WELIGRSLEPTEAFEDQGIQGLEQGHQPRAKPQPAPSELLQLPLAQQDRMRIYPGAVGAPLMAYQGTPEAGLEQGREHRGNLAHSWLHDFRRDARGVDELQPDTAAAPIVRSARQILGDVGQLLLELLGELRRYGHGEFEHPHRTLTSRRG